MYIRKFFYCTFSIKLVRTDLSGCLFPDCKLCEDGMRSGSHTRRGCVYQGQCKLCKDEAVTSTYHGESGRSGYCRTDQHVTDIKNADKKNAFVKHSLNKHPEHLRDPSIFEFKVNSDTIEYSYKSEILSIRKMLS